MPCINIFSFIRSLPEFEVRKAVTPSDVQSIIDLGVILDWVYDEDYDGVLYQSVDANGLYVGELKGKIISCVIMAMYGNNELCHIGYFIVDPEYRGKGYGRVTWDYAWSRIPKNCSCITLSAAPTMASIYEKKCGFKTAWKDLMYICSAERISNLPSPSMELLLVSTKDCAFDELIEYDASVLGYRRASLIKTLLSIPVCEGWVACDKQGRIHGYCNLVKIKGKSRWSVSPLYARDISTATILLKEASSFVMETDREANFFIIPPDANRSGVELIKSVSIQFVEEFVRMFAGTIPEVVEENVTKKCTVFSLLFPAVG